MPPVEIDPATREQNMADEKACGERIEYALKKYGCMFDTTCVIKNGFTQIQVGVVKIPAEMRKQLKEAEKNAAAVAPAAPEASPRQ